eukprot:TRINITY_DN111738_c0_g1_i1.p2 TRINITY_DN111738_c0_g1~~TRINITY_DN111738_c0_g1_i1.p2  ORF type:complete len:245 (+),score=55.11 TRINITY_DN111738_c0_g1_i1:77-811(+)
MIAGALRGMTPAAVLSGHVHDHASLLSTPKECQVLGDFFGFIVQGLLFGVCCSVLLAKWYFENPRREFRIFILDSSKQIVGAGVIHVLNMVCAVSFPALLKVDGDECAWYWVNIMIDTTFGVIVCYALLKASEAMFGYDSGHYGKGASTGIDWQQDPDYWKWAHQISVWCVIVSLMKLVVVVLMYLFASFWVHTAETCTHWIEDTKTRLVFVMIVTPTCMNIFQFCCTDQFIKYTKKADPPKEI